MTKYKIIIAVLAVALLGLIVFVSFGATLFGATGGTHYQKESFLQGLFFGTTRQANFGNDGAFNTSSSATFGGAVSLIGEVTLDNCGSVTWNPSAVSSSTIATTTVSVPNSTFGDSYIVSFSATSTDATGAQLVKMAEATNSTGSTTVQFTYPYGGAVNGSINPATGTLQVCYFN